MKFLTYVLAIFIIELILAAFAIYEYDYTLTALQAVTRYSGRFSLVFFSIIFLFHPKTNSTLLILLPKPYHLFAFVHGIHLVELLAYVYLSRNELNPVRLTGGVVAYLFIFLMPFLATKAERKKISYKQFFAFEIIYRYYLWLLFFMTYLPRVQGKLPHVGGNYGEHVILLGWVSVMMGMKISSLIIPLPYRQHKSD